MVTIPFFNNSIYIFKKLPQPNLMRSKQHFMQVSRAMYHCTLAHYLQKLKYCNCCVPSLHPLAFKVAIKAKSLCPGNFNTANLLSRIDCFYCPYSRLYIKTYIEQLKNYIYMFLWGRMLLTRALCNISCLNNNYFCFFMSG